jgi:hypothetical protein
MVAAASLLRNLHPVLVITRDVAGWCLKPPRRSSSAHFTYGTGSLLSYLEGVVKTIPLHGAGVGAVHLKVRVVVNTLLQHTCVICEIGSVWTRVNMCILRG